MKTGPTQEPTLRADRSIDSALVTVVLALFVAAAFGLNELPGGAAEWVPKEWKGVHDCAKGLILPLLALRLVCPWWVKGPRNCGTGFGSAMGLCWIGDIALTFSGDTAFFGRPRVVLVGACDVHGGSSLLIAERWEGKSGGASSGRCGAFVGSSSGGRDQFMGSCWRVGPCHCGLCWGHHHHGVFELELEAWPWCLGAKARYDGICRE